MAEKVRGNAPGPFVWVRNQHQNAYTEGHKRISPKTTGILDFVCLKSLVTSQICANSFVDG